MIKDNNIDQTGYLKNTLFFPQRGEAGSVSDFALLLVSGFIMREAAPERKKKR
jgi:hypothetical protein